MQRLDGLNFVCYFSGKKGPNGSLARLTGCWASKYEFHAWSNVVRAAAAHDVHVQMGYAPWGRASAVGRVAAPAGCIPPRLHLPALKNAAVRVPCWQVCVPRDHELYPHVERLTMRYAKYSTLYYSSDVTRPEAAAAETRAAE